MVLVVNLNLAVDVVVDVDRLTPGRTHRAARSERSAGGKGVNVCRVLRALGEPCALAGLLGGESGAFVARSLDAEGIDHRCSPIRGETRTCYVLNDAARGEQTVVNEPGPEVSPEELRRFAADFDRLAAEAGAVVVTGSLSPGVAPDLYFELITSAARAGRRVLVDAAGHPLRRAIAAGPFFVKVNQFEAGEMLGARIDGFAAAASALDELLALGANSAMITLGAAGAALAHEGAKLRVTAPGIEARNAVGSGDAAMAGLVAGLSRGFGAAELGRLAVAAGAANARRGMGRCSAAEVWDLFARAAAGPL